MEDSSEKISRLEKIMADTTDRNPHTTEIINAFRPLIIKTEQLLDSEILKDKEVFSLDEALFRDGKPLFEQNVIFHEDDPFEQVFLSLIPAFQEGFPKLDEVWKRLEDHVKEKKIRLYDFFAPSSDEDDLLSQWAELAQTDPRIIGFALSWVIRIMLRKKSQNWETLIQGFTWDKGYCPICGALPGIAIIKEGTSVRWLHCSECAHEWSFSRVICPGCGNKDQKTMTYFLVEDKELESTFVCEECSRYLITLNKVSDLADIDADIMALGLAHLDMIMQEKGFLPMAEPQWGIFS